jgi:hypothetical protein
MGDVSKVATGTARCLRKNSSFDSAQHSPARYAWSASRRPTPRLMTPGQASAGMVPNPAYATRHLGKGLPTGADANAHRWVARC